MQLQVETQVYKKNAVGALNTKINGAAARQQRIYFRTGERTTFVEPEDYVAPEEGEVQVAVYPTTWVDSDGTPTNVYNQWTTKIPPIAESTDEEERKYLFLYTCIQTQIVNGDISHTIALLDDTTTIIDGGQIITGSVDANQIAAHAITADKIDVENLSAIKADMGEITAGIIHNGNNSISFNDPVATLEFKNEDTWLDSTQGIKYDGSTLAIKGEVTATSLIIGSGDTAYNGVEAIESINKYITRIDEHGITIHPENQSGAYVETKDTVYNNKKIYYYINNDNQYTQFTGNVFDENVTYYEKNFYMTQITSDGFGIKKNGQTIASYGEKITIGDNNSHYLSLDENGLNVYNNASNIPIASFGETIQVGLNSGYYIKIDGQELGFFWEQKRVAYINNQKLSINQSVVLNQMDVGRLIGEPDPFDPDNLNKRGAGQWSWKVHKNINGVNNLYLKWIG